MPLYKRIKLSHTLFPDGPLPVLLCIHHKECRIQVPLNRLSADLLHALSERDFDTFSGCRVILAGFERCGIHLEEHSLRTVRLLPEQGEEHRGASVMDALPEAFPALVFMSAFHTAVLLCDSTGLFLPTDLFCAFCKPFPVHLLGNKEAAVP